MPDPRTAAELTVADFDYTLPPELIAQHPAPERSASRLLDGTGEVPVDRRFSDLPALLQAGDLLVFNDTRVIKARLLGEKAGTGGAVEALVERVLTGGREVLAHLRASKSPRPGSRLCFAGGAFDAEVLGRAGPDDALFRLRFPDDALVLLERHGQVPLPPYIVHGAERDDREDESRYQTVFARRPGAVAAPTAALHFDDALLAALPGRGIDTAAVTLHVGAGTFQPVRAERIDEHRMHSEWFEVGAETVAAVAAARARGGRVVAVGTTTLRALESAATGPQGGEGGRSGGFDPGGQGATLQPRRGETDIFIRPGHRFSAADLLVTNFHLPRSTLLMLVSAFAGPAHIKALYRHAVESRYRFFSYGDAMLLRLDEGARRLRLPLPSPG